MASTTAASTARTAADGSCSARNRRASGTASSGTQPGGHGRDQDNPARRGAPGDQSQDPQADGEDRQHGRRARGDAGAGPAADHGVAGQGRRGRRDPGRDGEREHPPGEAGPGARLGPPLLSAGGESSEACDTAVTGAYRPARSVQMISPQLVPGLPGSVIRDDRHRVP